MAVNPICGAEIEKTDPRIQISAAAAMRRATDRRISTRAENEVASHIETFQLTLVHHHALSDCTHIQTLIGSIALQSGAEL